MESPIISREDIIQPEPERALTTLEDVSAFIKQRQALFISKLGNLALDRKAQIGWQEILRESDGFIDKDISSPDKGLFTGSGLCAVASGALLEGLTKKSKGITYAALQIITDPFAENWDKTAEAMRFHHIIVQAKNAGDETLYIDPTYAQIDHTQAGKIAVITEDELAQKYRLQPVVDEDQLRPVTRSLNSVLSTAFETQRINPEKYNNLVESLT